MNSILTRARGARAAALNRLHVVGTRARAAAAVAGGVMLTVAGSAHAALPDGVQTAIDDFKANGIAIATAFLVAVIAISGIKYLKSAK